MSQNKRTVHHNLSEAVQGEQIINSLDAVARTMEDVEFHTTPITTHNAAGPSSEIKFFREPTLIWKGISVKVIVSERQDIEAITVHGRITFGFEREITDEQAVSFNGLLAKLDAALKERPKHRTSAWPSLQSESQEVHALKGETEVIEFSSDRKFRILALVHGEFGKRKVKNIREHGPEYWVVEEIELPVDLPSVIDDPAEFLRKDVPKVDLLLALQENANAAQLIVDYAKLSSAKALLAPVDSSEWLPEGQRNQIRRQLKNLGVECSFPRPFCVFEECGNPYLDEFARHFGRPVFKVQWEHDNVTDVRVVRGAPCGCSLFVAEKLRGVRVDEAPESAGLLHHHYPCLASMAREPDLDDTLMHKSGFSTKEAIDREIEGYKKKHVAYLDPSGIR